MRVSRLWGRQAQEAHDETQRPPHAAVSTLDFAIDQFDYVPVDDEHGLLRVAGAWGGARWAPRPSLAIHLADRTLRYEPLPAPPAAPEDTTVRRTWHGGYAVPADAITRDARYTLEAGDRSIPLPEPSGLPRDPEEESRAALEAARAEAEAERAERAQLQSDVTELRATHLAEAAEIARLREELAQGLRERDEARAAREEAEIAFAPHRLEAAERERDAAAAEAERLQAQVAGMTAHLEEATAETERLGEERSGLQSELSRATSDLEAAARERSRLEEELAVREAAVLELHKRGVDAQQRVVELEEQLSESREALRRTLRENLWEVQS